MEDGFDAFEALVVADEGFLLVGVLDGLELREKGVDGGEVLIKSGLLVVE